MTIFLRLFVAVAGVVLTIQAMAKSPLPVPTVESHKEFLVGDWKPNSPSVIVFTDPFCPYCLKAIERKHELDDVNLFMFWYPIFGEKSETRVAEFFLCESPVDKNVIDAVLQGRSPNCRAHPNDELEAINKDMYEAYSPPGVPAFYLGGQKVSFAEVKSIYVSERSGVNLEWERYSANRVLNDAATGKKAAIYLSKAMSAKKVEKIAESLKLNTEYKWYLFPSKATQLNTEICSILQLDCTGSKSLMLELSQEIALLYGLESQRDSQIIIDGRMISDIHLPKSLQSLALLVRL